jgi:hypothetical protein
MTAQNHWLSAIGSIPYWTTRAFSSIVTNDERRIPAHTFNCFDRRLSDELILEVWLSLSLSLMLRPTVSRPVCLGIKHPSGAYYQIFITFRRLRVCWCAAPSRTKGQFCRLQLLLVLASSVILGFESHETHDHILLSQIRGSHSLEDQLPMFICAGTTLLLALVIYWHGPYGKHRYQYFFYYCRGLLPSDVSLVYRGVLTQRTVVKLSCHNIILFSDYCTLLSFLSITFQLQFSALFLLAAIRATGSLTVGNLP